MRARSSTRSRKVGCAIPTGVGPESAPRRGPGGPCPGTSPEAVLVFGIFGDCGYQTERILRSTVRKVKPFGLGWRYARVKPNSTPPMGMVFDMPISDWGSKRGENQEKESHSNIRTTKRICRRLACYRAERGPALTTAAYTLNKRSEPRDRTGEETALFTLSVR